MFDNGEHLILSLYLFPIFCFEWLVAFITIKGIIMVVDKH